MPFDPANLVADYGDPFSEAMACRSAAALFDFSFVARGRIAGPSALAVLARLTSRRLDDMRPGQIRYALRSDHAGHLVADLTVWFHADGSFEMMSGRREDIQDLVRLAQPGSAADLSDETAIVAVQGPHALAAMSIAGFAPETLAELPYFHFALCVTHDTPCLVGRIGYTGEAGFEVVTSKRAATGLWQTLCDHARPAGFSAIDILRIEAGFVLFANEFRLPVTAGEAGLAAFSAPGGSSPADPLALIAFTADAPRRPVSWPPRGSIARPRHGEIAVTSACWSPHLGRVLGLGYVRSADTDAQAGFADPTGHFTGIERAPRPAIVTAKSRSRAAWTR